MSSVHRFQDRLLPQPPDPARAWRGTVTTSANPLRIQRYGGCEFRDMPLCHSVATEVGYPLHLATLLGARGVEVEFSDCYVGEFGTVPATREQLREHVRLSGDPDVVLVQIGMLYSYRTILGHGRMRGRVRDYVGRGLGRMVVPAYRWLSPLFRRGRHALEYQTPDALDSFLELVSVEWPAARVLVMGTIPVLYDGAFDREVAERMSHELLERAAARGVERMDLTDVVPADPGYYCANGAQLSPRGGQRVAAELLDWFDTRPLRRTTTPTVVSVAVEGSRSPATRGAVLRRPRIVARQRLVQAGPIAGTAERRADAPAADGTDELEIARGRRRDVAACTEDVA